jgi:hypothetical protein
MAAFSFIAAMKAIKVEQKLPRFRWRLLFENCQTGTL